MSSANGLHQAAEAWRGGTRSLERIIKAVSTATLLEDRQGCLECVEAIQEMHSLIDIEVGRRALVLASLGGEGK